MRVHRAMSALTLLCCASASILAQDKRAMTVDDLVLCQNSALLK